MDNNDQPDKLQGEINDKDALYRSLLDTLQNNPPENNLELFRLKKQIITIARQSAKLFEEYNNRRA